jgi:hypothetical protein
MFRSSGVAWLSLVEVITHWLAWNPGSGHSIRIGEDMILDLNIDSWLSPSLITTLKGKGIYYLFQARVLDRSGVFWLSGFQVKCWVF